MDSLGTLYPRALVTGGSRGLGRAFVECLLSEGVEVWSASRTRGDAYTSGAPHWLQVDLADAADRGRFLDSLRTQELTFDLLVNNAGTAGFGPFPQLTAAAFDRHVQLLLTAPAALCRAFLPEMLERDAGAIVNVTSMAARFPIPYMSLYNTAKSGLSALTRSLMLETATGNVTIIELLPGDYRTSFNDAVERVGADSDRGAAAGWERYLDHCRAGPEPETAARYLRRLLLARRSGSFACGRFPQARLAPLLARLVPERVVLRAVRWYYGLD